VRGVTVGLHSLPINGVGGRGGVVGATLKSCAVEGGDRGCGGGRCGGAGGLAAGTGVVLGIGALTNAVGGGGVPLKAGTFAAAGTAVAAAAAAGKALPGSEACGTTGGKGTYTTGPPIDEEEAVPTLGAMADTGVVVGAAAASGVLVTVGAAAGVGAAPGSVVMASASVR